MIMLLLVGASLGSLVLKFYENTLLTRLRLFLSADLSLLIRFVFVSSDTVWNAYSITFFCTGHISTSLDFFYAALVFFLRSSRSFLSISSAP